MKKAASFFKALSDEARLKMLRLLFDHQELCVCDFMETLEITQSKTSRHLRVLYHAGLVTDRREGLWSYYSLRQNPDPFISSMMAALKESLTAHKKSKPLLKKLEIWQKKKNRKAACGSYSELG